MTSIIASWLPHCDINQNRIEKGSLCIGIVIVECKNLSSTTNTLCIFNILLLFSILPSEFIWGYSWRAVAAACCPSRVTLNCCQGTQRRPKIKLSSPSSSHPELAPVSLHLNSHSWCLLWTGAVREDKERLPGGWERDVLHQQIYPHWCFDVTTGSSRHLLL